MDRFEVRAYYGANDTPGLYPPGKEAFHVWSTSQVTHQMEIDAAKARPEIGRIEVRVLRDWQPWETVFEREHVLKPAPDTPPEEFPHRFLAKVWSDLYAPPAKGTPAKDLTDRQKVALAITLGLPYGTALEGGQFVVRVLVPFCIYDHPRGGYGIAVGRDITAH